jgi:hypothetical protein
MAAADRSLDVAADPLVPAMEGRLADAVVGPSVVAVAGHWADVVADRWVVATLDQLAGLVVEYRQRNQCLPSFVCLLTYAQ